MNATDFAKAVDESADRAVKQFVELHKAVAISAFQLIAADSRQAGFKYGSPIWSGYYRSNHNLSIGQPDYSTKPEPDRASLPRWPDSPDKVLNAPAVSEASSKLQALKPFDVVYITNAVPYARRLEDGYSAKAPEGIYEPTAIAVREKYKNVTIKVK